MRFNRVLLPNRERCAYHRSPVSSSRRRSCRGLCQVIAKMRPFSVQSVNWCTLFASVYILVFSRHGPFIVRSGQLFRRAKGFTLFSTRLSPSTKIVCFLLFYTPSDGSIQQVSHHLVVECGIHGQQKTNPAHLQCCCSTGPETGFYQKSARFVAAKTLILRSPSCSRFLPTRSCVSTFRSMPCSQPIRQTIRCRTHCHFGIQLSFL